MLGFAVVALFGLAVFSTIVATVNEMPKPNPAAYIYNYHKIPRDQKKNTADGTNMSTMFEVSVPPGPTEYEDDREQDRWAASNSDYEEDTYEEEDRNRPQKYQHTRPHTSYSNQMPLGLPPAYGYPPYPGAGYMSGGVGHSSAGAMRPSDTSNKAFVPFFGYIDPIILIAIVAFPVLCTLGVTSLLMPIIPIVIYIIGLIFPSSRKLLKAQNKVNISMDDDSTLTMHKQKKKHSIISESSLRAILWLVEKSIDRWQKKTTIKAKHRKKKM